MIDLVRIPNPVKTYEIDVDALLPHLENVVGRLRERRKIPQAAQVVPLEREHFPEVIALHQDLPCSAEMASLRLVGHAPEGNYCPRRSTVLRLQERVIGAFLVQPDSEADIAFIYGVAVLTAFRRTWANAFLKRCAIRHLQRSGIRAVRFLASSSDTVRHAARAKARIYAA